jgi:F-type H+-transporting ATPase subunit a
MVRLFANITGGHIIILSLIGLTFIFESFVVGMGTAVFALAMNFLELLVAIVQAYIFTMLTANYIGAAVDDHHHHAEHH